MPRSLRLVLVALPGLLSLACGSCVDKTDPAYGQEQGARAASRPAAQPTTRPATRPAASATTRPAGSSASPHGEGATGEPSTRALPSTANYARLLQAIVRDTGVDYDALQAQQKLLDAYLAELRRASLEGTSRAEKLAFYINAYNAWTLRLVLDRVLGQAEGGGDRASVMAAEGFFERPDTIVAGQRLSLNALETLARELGDPRVHFAVNCASVSCPPLRAEPWSAETLDADLEQATRSFFATPHGAQLREGDVWVTQLLNWYAGDWGGSEGARNFVMRYAPRRIVDHLQSELKFLDYDWALNRAR